MKKIYFLSGLLFSINAISNDYSILKIESITAKENNEINEMYNSGILDGFVIKTTQGLFAFHSSIDPQVGKVLLTAKPTQCIKIHPNIDAQQNHLIYGIESAQIINCSTPKNKTYLEISITDYSQIKGEAEGLKVVDFIYDKKSYTYRVYCKNYTVRNVTNYSWSNSRLAYEEDKLFFSGENVISQVAQRICK